MNRIVCVLAIATALFVAGAARASDPIGGYMIVDKVLLEPADAPTTIQVWGSFALATTRGGREYGNPQRGYLYWKAPEGKEDVCRKEWNDLKKAAGTGQVIGFGSSFDVSGYGKVRKGREDRGGAETYPLGFGLHKCNPDTDLAPVRNLLALPAPLSPGDGDLVPRGDITLVIRNIADRKHPRANYVFELQGPGGDKEEATVEAGEKETRWTPRLKVKAGEKYTWRVRATQGRWKGPLVASSFVVKGER